MRRIENAGKSICLGKICEMKWFAAVFTILFLTAPGQSLWAGSSESGTVLSITGEAFFRETPHSDWIPMQKGGQIKEGSTIKTGAGSFVRVLKSDGSLMKIAAGKEIVLGTARKKKAEKTSGVTEFLTEFFSANDRVRLNAVRSTLTPLQQDWLAFNNFTHLPPNRIEAAFQLAAAYRKENVPNRSVFILWKLHTLFPRNEGLKALGDQAAREYQNTGIWEITRDTSDSTSDTVIYTKGAVRIRHRDMQESYAFLFQTIKNSDGGIKTMRLFPKSDDLAVFEKDTFFASRIAPEGSLSAKADGVNVRKDSTPFSQVVATLKKGQATEVLKEKGRRYLVRTENGITGWVLKHKLTGKKGTKGTKSGDVLAVVNMDNAPKSRYLWGWSAPGPLPNQAIQRSISEVENALEKDESVFSENTVKAALPDICGSVRVVKLVYR